jgi:hypothetical protein
MIDVAVAVAAAVAVVRLGVRRPWPHRVPGAPEAAGSRPHPPRHPSTVGPSGGAVVRRPARAGRAATAVDADLVPCVDLLGVAVTAGLGLEAALGAVAASGSGPVAAALGGVVGDLDRGTPLSDALGRLPERVGPSARPLVATLLVSLRTGAPLAAALQRLAEAERRRARRRVEARIRRLPVLLTLPLALCILPAFVVMTLVPLGWAAVDRVGFELQARPDLPSHPPTSTRTTGA